MKKPTMLEVKESNQNLRTWAGLIVDHYANAEADAREAFRVQGEAIKNLALCGQCLMEAQALVPKGQWQEWLRDNCQMSYETARRCIRVANLSHVTDLTGCKTIRQAYLACGIVHEEPLREGKPAGPATVEDLIRFAGFASRITPESFSGMVLEQGQREKLRERLKPAHEAYLALGDAA